MYAYANPLVYIDADGREAIDVVNGVASSAVNLFFGGPIDYGDRNDLSAEQKKGLKNFSFGDPLLEKSFKVDFRDLSVKKTISKGQTPLQKLVSTATLGLKDAGELIGKTAGAFSVSTDESFSNDMRNQADFEIGSALPSLASTGIARKGSAKSSTKLSVEPNKLESTRDTTQGIVYNHKIKPNKTTDINELERQVKGQENAFNKIINDEGIKGLKDRVRNYSPELEKEGRKRVKSLKPAGKSKAHLHEPDMKTGGKPGDISDVGSSRENSIIGGNANRVSKEILDLPDNTTCIKCTLNVIESKNR